MNKLVVGGVALVGLILGSPASAADYFPSFSSYNWTGFYLGAHGGGTWSTKDWTFTAASAGGAIGSGSSYNLSGFMGGGQAGANFQFGAVVFGIEGDFSGTVANDQKACSIGSAFSCRNQYHWFGTAAGRFGVAIGRALIYGKGGWAFADDSYSRLTAAGVLAASDSATRSGWMFGGGLEYSFWDHWSLKIEYNYFNLGTDHITLISPTGVSTDFVDVKQVIQVVKVGLNFRFITGPNAVAVRY